MNVIESNNLTFMSIGKLTYCIRHQRGGIHIGKTGRPSRNIDVTLKIHIRLPKEGVLGRRDEETDPHKRSRYLPGSLVFLLSYLHDSKV